MEDSTSVSASTHLADKYNEYSIQIIRWILKTINAWPRPADISYTEKIRSNFTIFMCYVMIISITIPNSLSLFFDTEQSSETKLINIGPVTYCTIGMVNYFCILMHADDIHDCIEHMKTDWRIIKRLEDQKVMLKAAKHGRFIAGFCALFMHSGVFSYNIIQGVFFKRISNVGNSSIVLRELPYPMYKMNFLYFSPVYEIVYFLQCLSAFVVSGITIATCGVAAVFVMHACGQIKVMISWLENLMNDKNKEKAFIKQKFTIIVNHHLRILNFVSRTEKIMTTICLIELFGCTMHICLLLYYIMMDVIRGHKQSILPHSMILTAIVFNIFIFCYIGEMLSEQGEQIGKFAYMTKWYLLPEKTAQGFILIILRSNAGLKLTAGKIAQLSFSTFGDIIYDSIYYYKCCSLNDAFPTIY